MFKIKQNKLKKESTNFVTSLHNIYVKILLVLYIDLKWKELLQCKYIIII